MNEERPPQFSPGEYIEMFLQKRGWSQADLAQVMGRPAQVVNEIILGHRGISPTTARQLAAAFGTSVEVWRNLDKTSSRARSADTLGEIELRAKVFALGPIKDLIRREWIQGSSKAQELREQVEDFYGLPNIDTVPTFDFHAARRSTTYSEVNLPLIAWLHQTRRVSASLETLGVFSAVSLERALRSVREAARTEDGVANVPSILSDAGIRFLIVEHLPKTRLDGACFWLEDGSPVIAMSMRYERIDHFWHTLFHELAHVHARDGFNNKNGRPDTDLPGSHTPINADRPESEKAADAFASEALIHQSALAAFIARNRPLYSRRKIMEFAEDVGIHPGIVVGQLQYRGEILYSHSRELLVSVRDLITASARTDGWKKRST